MSDKERLNRVGRIGAYATSVFLGLVSAGVGGIMACPIAVNVAMICVGVIVVAGWSLYAWREIHQEPPPPPTEEQVGAELYALTQKPIVVTIELTPDGREALMRFAVRKRVSVDQAVKMLWGQSVPKEPFT